MAVTNIFLPYVRRNWRSDFVFTQKQSGHDKRLYASIKQDRKTLHYGNARGSLLRSSPALRHTFSNKNSMSVFAVPKVSRSIIFQNTKVTAYEVFRLCEANFLRLMNSENPFSHTEFCWKMLKLLHPSNLLELACGLPGLFCMVLWLRKLFLVNFRDLTPALDFYFLRTTGMLKSA